MIGDGHSPLLCFSPLTPLWSSVRVRRSRQCIVPVPSAASGAIDAVTAVDDEFEDTFRRHAVLLFMEKREEGR